MTTQSLPTEIGITYFRGELTEAELMAARPATVPDEGVPQWIKYALVAAASAAATHFYQQYVAA